MQMEPIKSILAVERGHLTALKFMGMENSQFHMHDDSIARICKQTLQSYIEWHYKYDAFTTPKAVVLRQRLNFNKVM